VAVPMLIEQYNFTNLDLFDDVFVFLEGILVNLHLNKRWM
jgi:hypothetical protein